MSWQVQDRKAMWFGFACIGVGSVFAFLGPIAFLFIALPLMAVGLGSIIAAHTIVNGG